MKLDVAMLTHDLRSVPDYARKVEAMGFDCLWSAETQHDPFLPLAAAATVTDRIKLGTSIAVAFPRSPMVAGPHLVGPRQGLGRALHPRPRLPGEGAQRTTLLGQVRLAGAPHA